VLVLNNFSAFGAGALLSNRYLKNLTLRSTNDMVGLPTTKGTKMAIFEFSDGFDAQGWYTEQMRKREWSEDDDYFHYYEGE